MHPRMTAYDVQNYDTHGHMELYGVLTDLNAVFDILTLEELPSQQDVELVYKFYLPIHICLANISCLPLPNPNLAISSPDYEPSNSITTTTTTFLIASFSSPLRSSFLHGPNIRPYGSQTASLAPTTLRT